MTAIVANVLYVLYAAGLVGWFMYSRGKASERIEDLGREIYAERSGARAMAIHLRGLVLDGVWVDDRTRAAMDRSLAWCPASPNDRHRVRAGRCVLCGLGGLAANDAERGGR